MLLYEAVQDVVFVVWIINQVVNLMQPCIWSFLQVGRLHRKQCEFLRKKIQVLLAKVLWHPEYRVKILSCEARLDLLRGEYALLLECLQ